MQIPHPEREEVERHLRQNLTVGAGDQNIPFELCKRGQFVFKPCGLKDGHSPCKGERLDGGRGEDALPALRAVGLTERGGDVIPRVEYFLKRLHRKFRRSGIDDFHNTPDL